MRPQSSVEPCIYCGSSEPPRDKREHVIPRLLGTFQQNWTLDCVCDDCNEYFGEQLEVHFGRDSTEALYRLQYGTKKASESSDLPYKRITLIIEQEGPFHGARATIGPDAGDGVQPIPLPQVGYRRLGEARFEWLLESELTDEKLAPYRSSGWQINVIGPTDADHERLIARIQVHGVAFKRQSAQQLQIHNEKNEVTVLTEATLDISIQRAIAKIAMNFAAHVVSADFVRNTSFEAARGFIRFGLRPGFQVVALSDTPILADDGVNFRQTKGHLIVIGWESSSIVVRFSPFNFITYRIVLGQTFDGIWRDIAAGFLFDYEHHEIVQLTSTRLIKPLM